MEKEILIIFIDRDTLLAADSDVCITWLEFSLFHYLISKVLLIFLFMIM